MPSLYSRLYQTKILEIIKPFQKVKVLEEFLSPPCHVPMLNLYFVIINFWNDPLASLTSAMTILLVVPY